MLPGGLLLAAFGLIGWTAERWRWGRGPHVTRIEIVLLFVIPVGAAMAVAGLLEEVL